MRTTFNLNDSIYQRAVEATGIREKTKLLHLGLESLIRKKAIQELVALKGSFKKASVAPRRRYS